MIKLRNVRKTYRAKDGDVVAVDDPGFELGDDEFLVLLGPSGSGKTTLLRCVAGLETPEQGEIEFGDTPVFSRVAGKKPINVPAEKRGVGMVFQSYAVWPHLSVAENVALPLTHGRVRYSRSEVKERVSRALQTVQLTGLDNRPAPMLSGGQQQRVALARALAIDPVVLLMDEPLSNLDARLREEVRFEIREITRRAGLPVLYVTHDQTEAMALADRIGVMDAGKILQLDVPNRIYEQPATTKVAEFVGSMNWLDGRVTGERQVETAIGTLTVAADVGESEVRIGIRPEHLELSASPMSGANCFTGRVTSVAFLGDHSIGRLDVNSTSFAAKDDGGFLLGTEGSEIHVRFPEQAILVFPREP